MIITNKFKNLKNIRIQLFILYICSSNFDEITYIKKTKLITIYYKLKTLFIIIMNFTIYVITLLKMLIYFEISILYIFYIYTN